MIIAIMLATVGMAQETVQIGNQVWMKQNLNVGVMIQGSQNQTNNNVVEKYCYENNEYNCSQFGGLYQWDELMQYLATSPKGLCPNGFHVPTNAEYNALIFATLAATDVTAGGAWMGYNNSAVKLKNNVPVVVFSPYETLMYEGKSIFQAPSTIRYYTNKPSKFIGSFYQKWGQPDERGVPVTATNESGFTAIAGGFMQRPSVPMFYNAGGSFNAWTSTPQTSYSAYNVKIAGTSNGAFVESTPKYMGLSVRCIKD